MAYAALAGVPVDAAAFRRAGVNVNQEDLPHWCQQIGMWLTMVSSIQQGYKPGYRAVLKAVLDGKGWPQYGRGPGAVYKIHEDYCTALEADANKGD